MAAGISETLTIFNPIDFFSIRFFWDGSEWYRFFFRVLVYLFICSIVFLFLTQVGLVILVIIKLIHSRFGPCDLLIDSLVRFEWGLVVDLGILFIKPVWFSLLAWVEFVGIDWCWDESLMLMKPFYYGFVFSCWMMVNPLRALYVWSSIPASRLCIVYVCELYHNGCG